MRTIVLEGPDEVGKTTLAKYMCGESLGELPTSGISQLGGVYDRCWVTDLAYRLGIPQHDWSAYHQDSPIASPGVDLVIILPGDKDLGRIARQVAGEHGYTADDYTRVVYMYMCLYDIIQMSTRTRSGLFKSVAMIQWNEGELVLVKGGAGDQLVAAQAVIEAAREYNNTTNN